MLRGRMAAALDVAADDVTCPLREPAFDATQFNEMREMIGQDGVLEMVDIFEAEMRQRLKRLAAPGQNIAAVVREMHTLKGAAGTVASPRLAAIGWRLEQAARRGTAPSRDQLRAVEDALKAYLLELRLRNGLHEAGG